MPRIPYKGNDRYTQVLFTVDKMLIAEFRSLVAQVHGTSKGYTTTEINEALRNRIDYLRIKARRTEVEPTKQE